MIILIYQLLYMLLQLHRRNKFENLKQFKKLAPTQMPNSNLYFATIKKSAHPSEGDGLVDILANNYLRQSNRMIIFSTTV